MKMMPVFICSRWRNLVGRFTRTPPNYSKASTSSSSTSLQENCSPPTRIMGFQGSHRWRLRERSTISPQNPPGGGGGAVHVLSSRVYIHL